MRTKSCVDEALLHCGWEDGYGKRETVGDPPRGWHWEVPDPRIPSLSVSYQDGYHAQATVALSPLQVVDADVLEALQIFRRKIQCIAEDLDAVLDRVAVLQEEEAEMPPPLCEDEWDRLIQWVEQQPCA